MAPTLDRSLYCSRMVWKHFVGRDVLMIRNDYKDGSGQSEEQIIWEKSFFGSPELRKAYGSRSPLRRFLQIGISVRSEGEFARNEDVEFHLLFDRKRRVFFGKEPERARPLETMAVVGRGYVWGDGSVSIRPDAKGCTWFDLSNRPYSTHQNAIRVRVGKQLRLPPDVPFTGKLRIRMTPDGRNLDFVLDGPGWEGFGIVVFRFRGDDFTGIRPAAKLTGIETDQLVPGCDIPMTVDSPAMVLSTQRKRIGMFKSLWTDGQPVWTGPRPHETLNLSYPHNRRVFRAFLDMLNHANNVALNKSSFLGLVTAEEWAPAPYYCFRSTQTLLDALRSPRFEPSEELLADMQQSVLDSGFIGYRPVDVPGRILHVTELSDPGFVLMNYAGGYLRRVMGKFGEPILFRHGDANPVQLSCISELAGKELRINTEILLRANPDDFSSLEKAKEVYGERLKPLCAAFVERRKAVAGAALCAPARYCRSIVHATSRNPDGSVSLAWRLRGMERYREARRGQYFAPPVYVDVEQSPSFTLKGVEYFAGIPSDYRRYRGLQPPRESRGTSGNTEVQVEST